MKSAVKCKCLYPKRAKYYTCPCGHVFCECQCSDFDTTVPMNDNELKVNSRRLQCKCKRSKTEISDTNKNSKDSDAKNFNEHDINTSHNETVVTYQNKNYINTESNSSTDSCLSSKSRTSIHKENNHITTLEEKSTPRPVTCPVSACGKMVAVDSISQHFYFDHSKIPRIVWSHRKVQEILLKASNFMYATNCMAIFFLESKRWSDLLIVPFNPFCGHCKPILLLMGAKIDNKEGNSKISDSNILKYTTQTNYPHVHNKNNKCKRTDPRKVTFCFKDNQVSKNSEFIVNNDILLWICSLNMYNRIVYSITLFREDKKLGYSYVGESIDITDNQDPGHMFQREDCLIVRGLSATKLQNDHKEINAIVNILD